MIRHAGWYLWTEKLRWLQAAPGSERMHLPNALGFTPLHAAVMHTTTARAAITNADVFVDLCVDLQSVSQSVSQTVSQVINWSISHLVSQSDRQTDRQTVSQTDSRSVYQVINWSVTRPLACCQVAGESSSAEPMIAMIHWLLRHTGFRSLASSDRY